MLDAADAEERQKSGLQDRAPLMPVLPAMPLTLSQQAAEAAKMIGGEDLKDVSQVLNAQRIMRKSVNAGDDEELHAEDAALAEQRKKELGKKQASKKKARAAKARAAKQKAARDQEQKAARDQDKPDYEKESTEAWQG